MKTAVMTRTCCVVALTFALATPTLLWAADPTTPPVPPPPISLPRTGQISTYDQTGQLIDFKGSGQDGEFQRGAVWPDPRFVANGDGTVSDTLTGLMWIKDGNCFEQLPWPTALQLVADFNKGTAACHDLKSKYQDWAVPGVDQLVTLFDAQAGVLSEYLKLSGFIGVQSETYWSSTAYRGQLKAWAVDFANGQVTPRNKIEPHFMLMVRVEVAEKSALTKVGEPASPAPPVNQGSAPAPPPGQRFVEHGDGTVTDTFTGLMWLQHGACFSGLDWQGALAAAKRLNGVERGAGCPLLKSSYNDWFLPNSVELRSLVDYGMDFPSLSPNHPFKEIADGYWTATTVAASPGEAFIVDFDTGAMRSAPKSAKHRAMMVRSIAAPPDRARKEAQKGANLGVLAQYVLTLDPALPNELLWPPKERFVDNGDGTSLDALTGMIWLTDASCFGKRDWNEASAVVKQFNAAKASSRPSSITCAGYEGGVDDWEVPTLAELRELVPKEEKDGALWLNQQGLKNVQGGGIYWTSSVTPLNLYYADGFNLKTGKAGQYPKSLKFFVWPKRKVAEGEGLKEPLLNMAANGITGRVTLTPNDSLALVGSLHTFGLRTPADFWFWYDTPDEKRLWLTPIRTWTDKATPVYQGPLFNLSNYEIYRSVAMGLAPGVYDFHFAVDMTPNGVMDEPLYEGAMSVVIPATPEE